MTKGKLAWKIRPDFKYTQQGGSTASIPTSKVHQES